VKRIIFLIPALLLGLPSALGQGEGLPPGHPSLEAGAVDIGTAEITISLPHLLVEQKADGIRSVAAYVLTAVAPAGGDTREFLFAVPEGATAPVSVRPSGSQTPIPPERLRPMPGLGAWAVDLPAWEGEIQLSIESFIPGSLEESGFLQRFLYPVTDLTLLVRPKDLVIAGKGLQFAGVIDMMNVSQWIGSPIEAGGSLEFHVHAHTAMEEPEETSIEILPNRMTLPRTALLLGLIVFLGIAVAVASGGSQGLTRRT